MPGATSPDASPDGDFDGALAGRAVVDESCAAWRYEVSFAEQFARDVQLDFVASSGRGNTISLRELLVHLIEEYAR